MPRCEWRLCSHKSEVASFYRNATDNVHQPWQLAEPPDDGRRGKCSLAPCRRFPLERLTSQMECCIMSWGGG